MVVRIWGQAPLGAEVTSCDRYRCNACGAVFTAQAPTAQSQPKYDASAGAMLALLRYGTGMPFYRLEQLQAGFGIPLPSGTQWEVVHSQAKTAELVHGELMFQAAQSDLIHNDDTVARVLALMSKKKISSRRQLKRIHPSGRACSPPASLPATSKVILSCCSSRGGDTRGENLALVLAHRAAESKPPIQMSDGLSRNRPKYDEAPHGLPKKLKTIWANCLAHARRKYADLVNVFRPECQHVLETLAHVYHNDEIAARQQMSPKSGSSGTRPRARP